MIFAGLTSSAMALNRELWNFMVHLFSSLMVNVSVMVGFNSTTPTEGGNMSPELVKHTVHWLDPNWHCTDMLLQYGIC